MFGWIKNIGLSWKVQLAPAFLIVVLIGLGAYALQALRSNQTAVDALFSGPVRQSELAADLTTAAWIAHAKLYRLAATAANEKDDKQLLQQIGRDVAEGDRAIVIFEPIHRRRHHATTGDHATRSFSHLIDGERVLNNAHSPDISREDYP